MRRSLLALLVVAAGATRVSAQEPLDFVGDRETATQLSRILESVRGNGLPVDPVISKARHAAMIHAPASRLLSAAQAVARRLELAREALGPRSGAADLAAGEDALSVTGVTTDMLVAIRAAQPSRSIAVPLGVMTQLVASGVKPAYATEIVSRLTRAGANNAQLVALGNDVNQDVIAGAGAMASLQTRLAPLRPLLAHAPLQVPAQTLQGPTISNGTGGDPKGRGRP
jgi:hypothetical protein